MEEQYNFNTNSFSRSYFLPFLFMSSAFLTGCLGNSGGNGGSADAVQNPPVSNSVSCQKPFTKTVLPDQIKGSGEIYFSIDKLDFLTETNRVFDSIVLEVTYQGKPKSKESVTISLNGIKTSKKDGPGCMDSLDDVPGGGKASGKFHLHKLLLNGGEPFDRVFAKIKKSQGVLKLSLHGENTHIISAAIIVTGSSYADCNHPPVTTTTLPTTGQPAAVTIDSVEPAQTLTASTSISILFSSHSLGTGFHCSLDGGNFEPCTSPQAYSNLSSGDHTFQVYASNFAKNGSPVSYSWTVDDVPPNISITNISTLPNLTKESSLTFEFQADEPNSVYRCSVDGAESTVCSSPFIVNGLTDGSHIFSVNATDALGNTGAAPATFQWTVDLTAPVSSIVSVLPAEALNNVSSKTIDFIANETASFECSLDGAAFSSCISPFTVDHLAEGSHWFEVRATDVAGNSGLATSYAWTIDLTAPVIQLGIISPAVGLSNAQGTSVEFFLSETATANCAFDGTVMPCVSPFTAAGLAEGDHTLVISAVDLAGNAADPVTLKWTLDRTAPVISFDRILPSAASYLNTPDVAFYINAGDSAILQAALNGVGVGTTSLPVMFSGLLEGDYIFNVSGADGAGNVSNTLTHAFHVDLTVPVVSLAASETRTPVSIDKNEMIFSASEAVTFECNLDEIGFSSCESPTPVSGLADGQHLFSLRATDLAGNVSAVAEYRWTVDTLAPTTDLVAHLGASGSVSFDIFSNEASVTFSCSLDGETPWICGDKVDYAGLASGTHNFSVHATDLAGNMDPTGASYDFVILPPIKTTITSVSPTASITNQTSTTFTFAADQIATGFLCSMDNGAAVSCSSPVVYTQVSNGNHQFTVRAFDQYGVVETVGATYTWTVDTIAPRTSLVGSQSGSSITFSLTSTESGSFLCSLDGSVLSTCTSPVAYTGLAPGNHTFLAKAVDSAGNVDSIGASYQFNVPTTIHASIVSVSPAASLTNLTSIAFTLSANEQVSGYLCTLDNGPWTPCNSPVSYSGLSSSGHNFLAKAKDRFGNVESGYASYTWTIDNVAPSVSGVSTSVTTNSITVNWTTSEPASMGVRYGVGTNLNQSTSETMSYTTTHSVRITGLSSNTLYSVQVFGRDQAGNSYNGSTLSVRTSR